ncbi:MAG: hypothetical protein HZB67_02600 [Candidatus Aenigmarchaeota archaeon]|nr:hypothetical protein [Candidatus Aenigmarchaeota archaeon]
MKGVNPLISSIVVVAIVVASTLVVTSIVTPVVKQGKEMQGFSEAKQEMTMLDSLANSLYYEAPGATRIVKMHVGDGKLVVSGEENRIKYVLDSESEPMKTKEGKLTIMSGPYVKAYEGDADGDGNTDLIIENEDILFAVRKYGNSTNYAGINVSELISTVKNKKLGISIKPKTTIYINETIQSGNGFTELTVKGNDLTSAGIRFLMSSTISYEAIFTLSAGADFVDLKFAAI